MSAGIDIYPEESVVAAKLNAWSQWRRGDGVRGTVAGQAFDPMTALTRELNRDNFRLPMLVSDAEHTDRAIKAMRKDHDREWLALECYHLRNSASRRVAQAARVHHADVPAILRRAHDNFRYFRAQAASMKLSVNPAPALA